MRATEDGGKIQELTTGSNGAKRAVMLHYTA